MSSLPLQVMVYYNIQYALMFVVAILASHVHKVRWLQLGQAMEAAGR